MKTLKYISGLILVMFLYIGLTTNVYAACEHGYFSAGGDGSQGNPYLVSTFQDLKHALEETNVYYYKQLNNITITASLNRVSLCGIYDGNNKELILSNSYPEQRILGWIVEGGTLKNVTFSGQTTGFYNIHTVLYGNYGTMENVTNKINMQGTEENCMGGLTRLNAGKMISCKNYSNFIIPASSTAEYIGGIAGFNRGEISSCYSVLNVTVNSAVKENALFVGGIVGQNEEKGVINNCYAQEVNLTNNRSYDVLLLGGIAGLNHNMIENSYGLGAKISGTGSCKSGNTGTGYVGTGIANNIEVKHFSTILSVKGTVTNCYYLDKNSIGVRSGRYVWDSALNPQYAVTFDGSSTAGKRTDAQMKSSEQVVLLNQGQSMPGWKAGTNGWLYPEPLGFVEMKMDTSITVIGDNTKVPLSLKWSSNISTVEILDKTNNISLYKGVPQSNIAVELSKDGDTSLVCRGYATSGELLAESPAKIINKRSVLNEILKEAVSSVNPLRVMAVMDGYRTYDINTSNQQSINKILEYNPPLYFISDNLPPIFNVFLKTS